MNDVLSRERAVVTYLRQNPRAFEPIDAIAAVVWPEFDWPELATHVPHPQSQPCRRCGVSLNELTPSCPSCRERHRKRKKDAEKRAA